MSSFVLVSMGRYCQERATQFLNDFAAVGRFLLNCEETVSRWLGSCLNLTNGSMYRHSVFRVGVKSGLLNRLNPAAADMRSLRNCNELNDLSLCPADYAWGHSSYPTEVSGQVALVGESG